MSIRQRGRIEKQIESDTVYKDTTNNISDGLNSVIDICFMQVFSKAYEELTRINDHLDVLEKDIMRPDPHRIEALQDAWNKLMKLEEGHKKALRSSGFAK
jgi:hypothetical protein